MFHRYKGNIGAVNRVFLVIILLLMPLRSEFKLRIKLK